MTDSILRLWERSLECFLCRGELFLHHGFYAAFDDRPANRRKRRKFHKRTRTGMIAPYFLQIVTMDWMPIQESDRWWGVVISGFLRLEGRPIEHLRGALVGLVACPNACKRCVSGMECQSALLETV